MPTLEHLLNPRHICLNCMSIKGQAGRCCHCGYDEQWHKNHPLYLKPRTLLKNQYWVGKALGQGGFGITYIGLDQWLRKRVAIKEFLPAAITTRDYLQSTIIPLKKQEDAFTKGLQSFLAEARHLAKFNHPHIVQVLNFFEENQTGYMVMEYLEGENLTDKLKQQNSFNVDTALAIVLPILDALAEVHSQKLYHLDISPHNIRILNDGTPILIDFGAARQILGENSQTLDLVLKHGYSPIEQYSGRGKIGAWTDVYACGVLLYQLITGATPDAATDRLSNDTLKLTELGLAPHLQDALQGALAIRPEQRFQQITDLKAALLGEKILPPAVPLPVVNTAGTSARPSSLSLITLAILLLINGGIYRSWLSTPPPPAQPIIVTQAAAPVPILPPVIIDENRNFAQEQELVTHYLNLALHAQQQQEIDKSIEIAQQGLAINPEHTELKNLLATLKQTQNAQQALQAKITDTLKHAEVAVNDLRLTEPISNNAFELYQTVLSLDADNETAKQGLNDIANTYVTWARAETDNKKRQTILEKGLKFFPQHAELQALQRALLSKPVAPPVISKPAPVVVKTEPAPKPKPAEVIPPPKLPEPPTVVVETPPVEIIKPKKPEPQPEPPPMATVSPAESPAATAKTDTKNEDTKPPPSKTVIFTPSF